MGHIRKEGALGRVGVLRDDLCLPEAISFGSLLPKPDHQYDANGKYDQYAGGDEQHNDDDGIRVRSLARDRAGPKHSLDPDGQAITAKAAHKHQRQVSRPNEGMITRQRGGGCFPSLLMKIPYNCPGQAHAGGGPENDRVIVWIEPGVRPVEARGCPHGILNDNVKEQYK